MYGIFIAAFLLLVILLLSRKAAKIFKEILTNRE